MSNFLQQIGQLIVREQIFVLWQKCILIYILKNHFPQIMKKHACSFMSRLGGCAETKSWIFKRYDPYIIEVCNVSVQTYLEYLEQIFHWLRTSHSVKDLCGGWLCCSWFFRCSTLINFHLPLSKKLFCLVSQENSDNIFHFFSALIGVNLFGFSESNSQGFTVYTA